MVETDEELLSGLSFPAYRRVATLILLPSRPGKGIGEQVANIDPLELQAALERDVVPIFDSCHWRDGLKAADFLGSGVVEAENVVPRWA